MLEALIFFPEPSSTSLCGGCNAALGCVVVDRSPLRSTWLCFPKYLRSKWIIFISHSKYYSSYRSGKINGCFTTVKGQTSVREVNFCSRQRKLLLQAMALCSSENFHLLFQQFTYSHRALFMFTPLAQPWVECHLQKHRTVRIITWSHIWLKILGCSISSPGKIIFLYYEMKRHGSSCFWIYYRYL